MPVGGQARKAVPRSTIRTSDGEVYSVTSTALEVQEMVELTYQHGHPEKLMEFTLAFNIGTEAPWHGKRVFIRADTICGITPAWVPDAETSEYHDNGCDPERENDLADDDEDDYYA